MLGLRLSGIINPPATSLRSTRLACWATQASTRTKPFNQSPPAMAVCPVPPVKTMRKRHGIPAVRRHGSKGFGDRFRLLGDLAAPAAQSIRNSLTRPLSVEPSMPASTASIRPRRTAWASPSRRSPVPLGAAPTRRLRRHQGRRRLPGCAQPARQQPSADHGLARAEPASSRYRPRGRLSRPLARHEHPLRGDNAHARRYRLSGQGALCRCIQLPPFTT